MITEEKVIEQFKNKHKDSYDYSLVVYINNLTRVKIICKEHGMFEQTPQHHKRGSGCPKCSLRLQGAKSLSHSDFINKANIKHNYRYDYSLTQYKKSRDKVEIICKEHGIFTQNSAAHLIGQGCPKCVNVKYISKYTLLKKFDEIHIGRYKYNLIKEKYRLSDILIIKCSIHGEFKQKIANHLLAMGCQKCGGKVFNTNDFINKANIKHNYKYDYSLTKYERHDIEIDIICNIHGVFKQKPVNHIQGSGCYKCNESKGERIIRDYLSNKNINFETQKKFTECINKRKLPFDFYLPDYNLCIEYNGIQHYEPVECFGGYNNLIEIKKRDKIKSNYCKSKNINLLIIPFYEKNNIYSILDMYIDMNID